MPKEFPTARPFLPRVLTLPGLERAAKGCQGCGLYRNAIQTVFGEGAPRARVMLIGEQPGDQEDKQGRPFVGPAGRVLDRALADAAIDRSDTYVTNVVKHFKNELRGKRRIHKKPLASEIAACMPWLEAEMEVVHPEVLVCLGATASQALLGRSFRLTRQRGTMLPHPRARGILATVHPSALLRIPEQLDRHEEYARFVDDLRVVRTWLVRPARRAS